MAKRKRPATTAESTSGKQASTSPVGIWIGTTAFMVILVVFVWALFHAINEPHTTGGPPGALKAKSMKPINGIPCNANEYLDYHIHSHLEIWNRGKPVTVPQDIGIPSDSCLYWLHTHDASGIIHVEAPKRFIPHLGDFFDVWGEPLSRSRVASAVVSGLSSMRVYVSGRRYYGNPRSISLRDHETIAIEIGPPFPRSRKFDWSGY